jgi:hypothetical protein
MRKMIVAVLLSLGVVPHLQEHLFHAGDPRIRPTRHMPL